MNCSLIKSINKKAECDKNEQNNCPSVLNCEKELIWEGCYECEGTGGSQTCKTCNMGHKMSESHDGKCVECVNECCPGLNKTSITTGFCGTCDDDGDECVRCPVGYRLNDEMREMRVF